MQRLSNHIQTFSSLIPKHFDNPGRLHQYFVQMVSALALSTYIPLTLLCFVDIISTPEISI